MTNWRVVTTFALVAATLSLPSTLFAQVPEPLPDTPQVASVPTEGGEIIHSWALGPAGSDDPSQPSDRSTLSYTADPGSVINDGVTLYNLGNVALEFKFYPTDAINSDDGALDLLSSDEAPVGVGSWVVVGADTVAVGAGMQITIPISVVVPATARPGDHYGAIIASNQTAGDDGTGVVSVDRRTATPLQVRVNGPVTSELAITDLQADYDSTVSPLGGTMKVSYRIENRGDVSVAGTSNVTVGGPFGLGEKSLPPITFASLLPGQDIVVSTEVSGVPATVLSTTRVEVVPDPSGDDVTLQPVARSTTSFAPPIALLLALLGVLFALLAFRAMRRHRQRELADIAPSMPEREPQLT